MFEESARLPTHLVVEIKLREITAQGLSYYIAHKGERMGGLILLKLSNMKGQCKLLTQQRDLDGVLGWINALGEELIEERQADDYITRSTNRDPDLWVIEIEDREMNNPFMDD